MKEVTYEDWQKNPTPRMMWVWDDFEEDEVLRKVVYITAEETFPVVTVKTGDTFVEQYKHCAEIEKQRRMTKKELSRWLREKSTREFKYSNSSYVYSAYNYDENEEEEEVRKEVVIREDDGEWREPLVKVEE